MTRPAKKNQLLPEVLRLNAEGMSLKAAAEKVGVHPVTVGKWVKEAGVEVTRHTRGKDLSAWVTLTCDQCGKEFSIQQSQKRRFCSRDCTNTWQRENAIKKVCPCGKQIEKAPDATYVYTYRKYCSEECRAKYGDKRQKDPANYVTFACETCGIEVTRLKKYGSGAHKFCSNRCAARHTKVVKHYVVREIDMVLDSGWEALFAGLMAFEKIPCERFDRAGNIVWEGHDYGPDFLMPTLGFAVEVKGQEKASDPARWAAYREQRGRLLVLDQRGLEGLLHASDRKAYLVKHCS